jgi:hypothetical protein
MELRNTMTQLSPRPRRVAPLTIVLGAVFVFFCAVLVFVFVATGRANPVMLDQQGRPVNSRPQPANGRTH